MARRHARLLPVCTILYDERAGTVVKGGAYTEFQYKKVKHKGHLSLLS